VPCKFFHSYALSTESQRTGDSTLNCHLPGLPRAGRGSSAQARRQSLDFRLKFAQGLLAIAAALGGVFLGYHLHK
jgi:hypothetical protein